MEKQESILKLQKYNADVLENYLKTQNSQVLEMSKSLKNESVTTKEAQQMIFDCIANVQSNSLKALQQYFEGQIASLSEE